MTEPTDMMILHLPVKARWYDMQESGEKPEEYREITPYWCHRLARCGAAKSCLFRERYGQCHLRNMLTDLNALNYTHVLLRYGYTKRYFIHRIDSITVGRGNPAWGAPEDRDVFIIRHHKE